MPCTFSHADSCSDCWAKQKANCVNSSVHKWILLSVNWRFHFSANILTGLLLMASTFASERANLMEIKYSVCVSVCLSVRDNFFVPKSRNFYYNIASRATQSNSVTYACSKSRWCTLALMAWANRFARNFFSRERPLLAWGKIFRYFATIMDRNGDSTHQSQNEDNFRPFLLG